jgi:3-hydroxyisobutyrate dehydrogenase-like beta-hydroxyacid dehydrogenase
MGKMGLTISRSVINSGNEVHWTPIGRSQQTLDNAKTLTTAIEHDSLAKLLNDSDILFCIGRLNIGIETITAAAKHGFKGIYVDGNNLHGEESEREVREMADSANIDFVEALFRGFPTEYNQGGGEDKRDLYLSGRTESTKLVESLFSDGIWKVHICPDSAKALNRTTFKRLFS